MASDNKTLGKFILDGIPPAPRGVPQIEVTFDIDANGILNVSAKDKATGKEQSIRIESSCGASKEEIDKMKKDAEMHAEEDKKKQGMIEARNKADTLIYATEKTLKDSGDKISPDLKKNIEDKVAELKKVKDGDNLDEINAKSSELSQVIQKVGEELYKQSAKQQKPEDKGSEDKKGPEEGNYKEK